MVKKIFVGLLGVVLVITGVVLFNTFTFTSTQKTFTPRQVTKISESSLKHFQEAIHFQTISYGDSLKFDSAQFNAFHRYLRATYPLVHKTMSVQTVSGYSLIYKWEGKNPSLKPYILMAHQDVVPIEEASRQRWTVDPFAGIIKDNFIWGRGTADDKINLISIMEAAEKLIAENFQPGRTIYLAFGHDEEVGGKGATAMAHWFTGKNITAEMILDEGGVITKEKIPGVKKPVALIGTAEKGYLSLELSVEISGGHSSMPEKETSIDLLTKAITKLRANPFDARLTGPMKGFMKSVGPEMSFTARMVFANPWLFKKMIYSTYEKSGGGNAMLHTTLVPTIIQAGIKDNVIPTVALATINLRLLPGDGSLEMIDRIKKIIGDERIKINPVGRISEASAVSSTDSFAFDQVDEAIKESYPDVVSSPFLMIGATDSRHLKEVSNNIFKFSPMFDPFGFHGIDERVSLESYQTSIFFFENLMRNTLQLKP